MALFYGQDLIESQKLPFSCCECDGEQRAGQSNPDLLKTPTGMPSVLGIPGSSLEIHH